MDWNIMEYFWRHETESVTTFTVQLSSPLEVGNVFVDLEAGELYKVISVTTPNRSHVALMQTSPAGSCNKRSLGDIRATAKYVPDANNRARTNLFLLLPEQHLD
jgi:hypothetical protein